MKKLIISAIMLGSLVFAVPLAEANAAPTSAGAADPQLWRGQPRRARYGRTYSVVRTRIVRRGWVRYRETYRITYHRNGRTTTRVISRVRIR
jgi:hypothetical protein